MSPPSLSPQGRRFTKPWIARAISWAERDEELEAHLDAAESGGTIGVLVHMRPWLHLGKVSSIWQGDVDGVERGEEVLGAEDSLEDVDDGGLGTNSPGEGLAEGRRRQLSMKCSGFNRFGPTS